MVKFNRFHNRQNKNIQKEELKKWTRQENDNRTRPLCVAVVLALVFTGILVCVPAAQSKPSQAMQEDVAGDTNGQDQDAGVKVTGEPASTGNPDVTEEPASALGPSAAPNAGIRPKPSVKPTKTPVRLKPVSKVGLARYSTHSVKVTWKKHKKAKFYRVYYYKENGDVHLAGITKGTQYIVRKLKEQYQLLFLCSSRKKTKKCLAVTAFLQGKYI